MTDAPHRRNTQVQRRADVSWQGDLVGGSGTVTGGTSGAIADLPLSWPARVEDAGGKTSPEELLAAAHAACYAMAFSYELTGRGSPPERLQVSATVGLDPKVGGGFEVSSSHLDVTGTVPGLDQATFEEAARQAEQACPISNVLRGNASITVHASLS